MLARKMIYKIEPESNWKHMIGTAVRLRIEDCQPRLRRQLEDVDYVSVEFEGNNLSWHDPPEDALFAHPRLFRDCVPPGMHRFRGNIWDYDCKPQVMQTLGYPLAVKDEIPEITEARNIELGLGLQDLVMAERLLMKHLDAPGRWLQEKHRRVLMKSSVGGICGKSISIDLSSTRSKFKMRTSTIEDSEPCHNCC
ncbi:mitochondrial ribosome-associated GTPase 1-like [Hibiscus syriacus]|uniref:Mitochondrial ribosome-associated GTPase 1-like n=1 Tax=Hibiscus syriacus TaxID=106335 RepID=A0A6A3AKW3_HIBSY|nr:mitochondrial ribosome-associated GTPase 1-like [Hibiscus syriacus]